MEPISVQIEKYLEYCEKNKKLSVNTLRAYRIDTILFIVLSFRKPIVIGHILMKTFTIIFSTFP